MPFNKGKFSTHPGAVKSTGERTPPAKMGMNEQHEGDAQAAHGQTGPEHVTKTHPGETQPHPQTGVHAFHAHHQGGGKYISHTHHDGGDVETRNHANHGDVKASMDEALPDEQGQNNMDGDDRSGGMDFAESLGGIGGAEQA
jgi:hypothetical protein